MTLPRGRPKSVAVAMCGFMVFCVIATASHVLSTQDVEAAAACSGEAPWQIEAMAQRAARDGELTIFQSRRFIRQAACAHTRP